MVNEETIRLRDLLEKKFAVEIDGYSGWHEDQPVRTVQESTEAAPLKPVIQQVRREFLTLLDDLFTLVKTRQEGGPSRILQIGLGISGGSHFALEQVFEQIVTVDSSGENIVRFCQRFERDPNTLLLKDFGDSPAHASQILLANSQDPRVPDYLKRHFAPLDACFIDGDHTFDGVMSDWRFYAPMVRPGGFVVFHDHVSTPGRLHERAVDMFLAWLKAQPNAPTKFVEIGQTLGITYYVQEASGEAPLSGA